MVRGRMQIRKLEAIAGVITIAVLTLPRDAHALDAEVTSDTSAQFYDVRSPTGETILARRRLTTTLGVGAYDLLDHGALDLHAPELLFRARMRYDADYGADASTADVTSYGRLVPGFSRGP